MSSRRKLVWARTATSANALTAAAEGDVFDLLQQFRATMGLAAGVGGPPGLTVVRCRLSFFAASLTAGAIPLFAGVRPISTTDFAEALAGGTEGLEVMPGRDQHADWMFWTAMYPNQGADATTGVPNALTYEYDVRSQRKLDEVGYTLGLFLGKETSTNGVTVNWSASVLVMLP